MILRRIVQIVPIPVAGMMLSFSALDNLLRSLDHPAVSIGPVKDICGILALILFLLLTAKLVVCPQQVRSALDRGNQAAILPTYSMTLMNLSVFLQPLLGVGAFVLWWIGIMLHIVLVIRFTCKFILHLDWKEVFMSYVVGYAGFANVSITSPAYGMEQMGQVFFWVALCSVSCVLVLGIFRHFKLPEMDEADEFLFMVIASPMSVCLTGYIKSSTDLSDVLLLTLFCIATVLYLAALVKVPKFLKRSFYPSYASFTFPFVISAIGARGTMLCLDPAHGWFSFIHGMVRAESFVAVTLVLYTLLRYCIYLRQQYRILFQ